MLTICLRSKVGWGGVGEFSDLEFLMENFDLGFIENFGFEDLKTVPPTRIGTVCRKRKTLEPNHQPPPPPRLELLMDNFVFDFGFELLKTRLPAAI